MSENYQDLKAQYDAMREAKFHREAKRRGYVPGPRGLKDAGEVGPGAPSLKDACEVILALCQALERHMDTRKFATKGPDDEVWRRGCAFLAKVAAGAQGKGGAQVTGCPICGCGCQGAAGGPT